MILTHMTTMMANMTIMMTMRMTSGEGYPQSSWVGACGPLPKTPTLFKTKIEIFLSYL